MTRLRDKIKELDITIQNKLEQFHMLDKCVKKCQENEDYECMMDVYMAIRNIVLDLKGHHKEIFAMRSIVGDLRKDQEQIFEKVPEYCKIFETIEKFEPVAIFMQQPGHRDWCDINPHTLRGCTCGKEQK